MTEPCLMDQDKVKVRPEWVGPVLVFISLFALYLFTAPRTVVLEDDGSFILSGYFLGIEHPPGYPLYTLLAKLATLMPIGSIAWRVHALSGLFAALACVLIFALSRLLGLSRPAAYFAGLAFGVSEVFWSQAIIADVYSLHALIFFGLLYLAIAAYRRPAAAARVTDKRLGISAVLLGLGTANHWPLLVLSGPALLLWLRHWPRLLRRLPALALLFLVGILPYGWMVWRSHMSPEISFQGPIDSWAELADYFLRRGYREIDNSASATATDKLAYAGLLLRLALWQLLPTGFLLACIGVVLQWRLLGLAVASSLTATFLGPTFVLTLLLDFDYQPVQREAFRVYAVVAWGILALWAALGLQWLFSTTRLGSSTWAKMALVAALVAAPLAVHWGRNDRHGDWYGSTVAEALLRQVPNEARVLVTGDILTLTTSYMHLVEGVRKDVSLVSAAGLVLEPKLFDPRTTPSAARPAILDAYARSSQRPLVRFHNNDGRSGVFHWLFFELDLDSAPKSAQVRFEFSAADEVLLERLVNSGPLRDGWNELARRGLIEDFGSFWTRARLSGQQPKVSPETQAIIEQAMQTPGAALAKAELLSAYDPARYADEIDAALKRFAAHAASPWIDKRRLARFYNVLARSSQIAGRTRAEHAALQESIALWPQTDNPAQRRLAEIAPTQNVHLKEQQAR